MISSLTSWSGQTAPFWQAGPDDPGIPKSGTPPHANFIGAMGDADGADG